MSKQDIGKSHHSGSFPLLTIMLIAQLFLFGTSVKAQDPYEAERQYRSQLPQRCLALSGGGIRSALFAVGILDALSSRNELKNIDVISSVSGGGYASGWYLAMMHRFLSSDDGDIKKPFSEEEFRALVEGITNEYYGNQYGRTLGDIVFGATSLALAPINAALGDVLEESAAARQYRKRLERAFLGVGRLRSLLDFTPGSGTPSLKDLRQTVKSLNLPIFIFNATVQHGADNVEPPARMFEFSPFSYGSALTGYVPADDNFTLGDVVAISGAAIDLPIKNRLARILRDYSGVTLGRAIAPLRETDNDVSYYWLSDGGHVENLGVFPLLRRQCSTIFVADAEEDSGYTFDGYRQLKSLSRTYLNADLEVHDIEEWLSQTMPPGQLKKDLEFNHPISVGIMNQRLGQRPLRIIYLKLSRLSLPPDKGGRLFADIIKSDPEFPHYLTRNQYGISKNGMRELLVTGYALMSMALDVERRHKNP